MVSPDDRVSARQAWCPPSLGQKVRHKVFGEGRVVSSKLTRNDEEVTVAFPEGGIKKLMASLANLEVSG